MKALLSKRSRACMGLLTLLACAGGAAWAGVDESLIKEIQSIERELGNLPDRRRAEVQGRIRELQRDLTQAPASSRNEIRKELVRLDRELQSLQKVATRHFPDVRHKIAVFTFEDPAHTGLGDAVSFVASKSLLFHTPVRSLAIVNFQQGLAPDATGLSYFEKVDRVVAGQGYLASIWGEIGASGDNYVIDTYVQLHTARDSSRLRTKIEAAGLSSPLRGSLQSNRLWVQTKTLPKSAAKRLQTIAQQIRKLRATHDVEGEPSGELAEGVQYWINDRHEDWVQLETKDGRRGWTSVRQFCQGDCQAITDAADFVSQLTRYVSAGGDWLKPPQGLRASITAFDEQISLLQALNDSKDLGSAIDRARRWSTSGARPGGAALANLLALGQVRLLSAEGPPSRDAVAAVANDLAKAVLADPGNLDALHNLRVLFEYIGDENRASLARNLYDERAAHRFFATD